MIMWFFVRILKVVGYTINTTALKFSVRIKYTSKRVTIIICKLHLQICSGRVNATAV